MKRFVFRRISLSSYFRFAAIICCIAAVVGCAGIQPTRIDYYTLHYDPPPPREHTPEHHILQVERFGVSPSYHTTKFVYAEGEFLRNTYTSHQWRAMPQDLIAYYLARDIRASGVFQAVAGPESRLPADRVLSGTVDEFYETEGPSGCQAVLGVTIALLEASQPDVSKRVIFQKTYRQQAQAQERSASGIAAAMSEAMQAVSNAVIVDLSHPMSGS
ncbi:ABC-type transport auxiliary lipoprotein family protein [Desulfatirhabdium butyrativorans]|uniref:ABC-type transport auxiliary lipoprotein family protein n=1 Tax=Desulfatirhabdium butyrativorans TaxID=340467 RepID=UPI00041C5EF7|nr:ABC-type transport auxiliary lipoprotein family protein [Desulfatirhabdium butyrativorans]